ncbi:ATP-binding cassette domain-containing protein [Metallosphaera hakonensis]|nr:ATP-binding cassette domain-containing protein [Metallosphaera hakonensis]
MFVKRTVEDEVKFSSKDPDYYLKAFSLAHLRKEDPLTLSFGQRRRVAMASLLGKGQRIAMLDEPTSGQDWYHREVLGREINDLKERGISFLVVTHDSRFVEMFCDRVILMDQGKITARGTPEQVLHLTR